MLPSRSKYQLGVPAPSGPGHRTTHGPDGSVTVSWPIPPLATTGGSTSTLNVTRTHANAPTTPSSTTSTATRRRSTSRAYDRTPGVAA